MKNQRISAATANAERIRSSRKAGRPLRAGKASSARFELRLTGAELSTWTAFAERKGITLAQLVRESVEFALTKGSTR